MFKKGVSIKSAEEKRVAKHGALLIIKVIGCAFLLLPVSFFYELKKTYKSFNNYRKAKKKWCTIERNARKEDYDV